MMTASACSKHPGDVLNGVCERCRDIHARDARGETNVNRKRKTITSLLRMDGSRREDGKMKRRGEARMEVVGFRGLGFSELSLDPCDMSVLPVGHRLWAGCRLIGFPENRCRRTN